jgi:hypothetical protein
VALASGASIPAVHTLRSELGTAPVLLGFGPADDGAHGPDEHLELDDWGRAIDTMVVLLDRLAASSAVRVAGSHPRATLGAHRVVTRDQAEPVAPWPGAEPGHQVGTGEAADVSW